MIDTKALRQKVLDLAIRGKLVPQDPNDEPASVLLERIRAQKQQMVKEGKLKAKDIKNDTIIFVGEDNLHYEKFADGSVKCIEDEIPFDLPDGWAWARATSICVINPKNDLDDDIDTSFIPMPHICEGYENRHSFDVRKWYEIKTGYTHFSDNDIGIAKITPCFENRKSVVFRNLCNGNGAGTTELFILRPVSNFIFPDYLLWIAKTDDFISGGVQTFSAAVGQQRVSRDFVANYLIPLPPTNEQKRIIQMIGDTFAFINQIDHSKEEIIDTISAAKSKILDLAIRGQLVPQDPNDEPASVLLERIRAEKEELIKAGKIKRDKKESVIFKGEDNSYYRNDGNSTFCIDDMIPFSIPDNWAWCNLSMIGTTNIGLTYSPSDICESGTMVLRSSNIVDGQIDLTDLVRVSTTIRANQYMETNDILICARNGSKALVGKSAIFENINEQASFGAFMAVYRSTYYRYVYHFLNTDVFKDSFKNDDSKQINQLTQDMIKNTLIPLPPKNEQDRITHTIEQLFEEINKIKDPT